MSQRVDDAVRRAVDAFAAGQPVCVYDFAGREEEVDLITPATAVDPAAVARMRNDAGGLICVALSEPVADAFDLPFLADAVDHPAAGGPVAYDDRASFSLPVNHRETYTGVTDRDRALTIRRLGEAAAAAAAGEYDLDDFAAEFRSPGHVHLLRAAGSFDERRGHTELGIALAEAAGQSPAVVVCEMLDDETGRARSVASARSYAERHGLAFVEGSALVAALG